MIASIFSTESAVLCSAFIPFCVYEGYRHGSYLTCLSLCCLSFLLGMRRVSLSLLHFSLLSFSLHSVVIQQESFVDSETGVVLETFVYFM